jgi:hypothetical protein
MHGYIPFGVGYRLIVRRRRYSNDFLSKILSNLLANFGGFLPIISITLIN